MGLATVASVAQSIGESGNQFADAKLQAYNTRLQKLLDQLGIKREQTEEQEREERLRRLKLQPESEEAKLQQQVAAALKVAKQYGIDLKPEDIRSVLGFPAAQTAIKTPFELWRVEHPQGTAEQFQEFQAGGKPEKKIDVKTVPGTSEPYQITDQDGKTWNVNDPNLPKNLKDELATYRQAQKKGEETKATIEARKSAEALNRAMELADRRELDKERGKVFDTAKRGISGHSFLKTIAQQVNDAAQSGGVGNKWGDMLIAEGFMQLMFGVDPKALRGSPKMMEFLLTKQGGWDDRAIAEMNKGINGGQMSQAVRETALKQAQQQIESWDQQIIQTGGLVNDPKTKAIVNNYLKQVSKGEGEEAKALGGRQQ